MGTATKTRFDLTGKRFGRLTVIKRGKRNAQLARWWICLCDCGNYCEIRAGQLRNGGTKSCGCYYRRQKGLANYHPLKAIYYSMLHRCHSPSNTNYKRYGGRGITVCDFWRQSMENFINDMGERPSGYQLERIDNNKGYFKENCRWATIEEQSNNKSTNKFIEYDGIALTYQQWAKKIGISKSGFRKRMKLGWSIEKIINEPVKKQK